MTTSDRDVATALSQAIARRIGEPRYQLWFHRNTKFTWADDLLVVGVPNHFYQEWLENTFADAVRSAAGDVLGAPMRVRFTIDPELFQAARRQQQALSRESEGQAEAAPHQRETASAPEFTTDALATARSRAPSVRPARRWRRLRQFVVGVCNRLAHAAALGVVEAPGEAANPLVLHGPVGTGKSHLLEGIYVGLRKANSASRICFATAEDFTNRFVQSMRFGKLGPFRKHFRECEALLIDDLNFLANKRASQEEFLHTFDALLADGRQIVVTCDCHPKLAGEYSAELTDRLLGGAVWGLQPPDADTRLEILRAKSCEEDPPLTDDALRLLASQLHGNVRELEGAIHSVRHCGRVTGRPLDVRLAREALGDLLRHSVRVIPMAQVDRAVCRALQLGDGTLQSKQRAWAVSHPRMLAMYLARKHTSAAYSEIGRHFGGRNHSTVVAAEKKVRQWLEQDADFSLGDRRLRVRDVVELIERELLR